MAERQILREEGDHAIRSICVFCGSSPGANGSFGQAATKMGALLAQNHLDLVYGGGMNGIMGAIADGALNAGGRVIGVIPESMNFPGVAHEHLTELVVAESMHARKAAMFQLSDAFFALPGGMGTFEELFEILTWSQLGYQQKSIGILSVDGYYDPLVELIDHAVEQGFVRQRHRQIFAVDDDPRRLLKTLQQFEHPGGAKIPALSRD